jgi:hypothetical protein
METQTTKMTEEIQKQHLEAIEGSEEFTHEINVIKASKNCTKVTLQAIIDVLKELITESPNSLSFWKVMIDEKIKDLEKQLGI